MMSNAGFVLEQIPQIKRCCLADRCRIRRHDKFHIPVLRNELCVGCTACARVCPTKCISGEVKKVHVIDQSKCIKCGACLAKCKFDAISVR